MGTATSTIPAVLALLLLAFAATAQDTASLVREGKHFRIVFHGADLDGELAGVLADECLTVAEAFWPILEKLLPVRAAKPGTIHVYRSEKDYRTAEAKSPFRLRVEAFTTKQLEGHVLLGPELRVDCLQELGLPRPAADNLRFVAAEQVITPLVPASDEDGWLRSVAVIGALEIASNPKHQPGVDPGHDARRAWLVRQRSAGGAMTMEQLLRPKRVTERTEFDWLQACGALVAQQLAAAETAWAKKLLGKQRELKGHVLPYDRRKLAVESVLGDDWLKIETRFARSCKAMQPLWLVVAPLWQIGPQRSVLVGTSKAQAKILAVEAPAAGDYVIAGRAEFGPGNQQQGLEVHFGGDGKSRVGVFFEPSLVAIAEWHDDRRAWHRHGEARVDLPARQPFDFRIEVTDREVRVLVAELLLLTWPHGGREVHATLAVSTLDRLVWLEGLRSGPLAAPKK